MRRTWVLALAAGATLAVAAPSDVAAQSRSIRERWEESRRDERDDKDRDRDRERARAREVEQERARAEERERERIRERARAEERERERREERQRRINAAEERRREEDRLRSRRDRDDDWYDDDDYRRSGNGNGPAFCRSGAGHPVHGREWCRQHGYELGRDRGWERLDRDRWDNIVFRDGHRRREERLSRSRLAGLLGNTWLYRFESYGHRYGPGPLTGYWVTDGRANVLQLHVGDVPYVRLVDVNRDNRVDNVLVRR